MEASERKQEQQEELVDILRNEYNKEAMDALKNDLAEPRVESPKLSSASIPTIQHDTSNSSDLEIKDDLDIANIDQRLVEQAKLATPKSLLSSSSFNAKKKNDGVMLGDTNKEEKAKKIAAMYRSRRTKTYDDDQSGQESEEGDFNRQSSGSLFDSMRGKNPLNQSQVMTYLDTAGAEQTLKPNMRFL